MRASLVWSLFAVLGTLIGWPAQSAAQDVALARRAPRFLYSASVNAAPMEIDASRNAALRRVVTLDLEQPTVGRLLAELERQTGLIFAYGTQLDRTRAIPLQARSISVAAALTVILLDTDLDVVLSSGRQVAFKPRATRAGERGVGTIVGRVTDAKTGDPVIGAEAYLEGTRWRSGTTETGFYKLAPIPAGDYTLIVRRVGYAKQSRPVTVAAAQEVTVDLALEPTVTKLNEIVTTVTGDQRRLELGHVVGVINADSLVKEAPISTLSELLMARVPGLQVFQSQGSVGGDVHIQIRGANSVMLGTEPIFVVDGVRYTSLVPNGPPGSLGTESTSPLNDINPSDIESVEIVKGPSAATLYGTDAANGVVVITTKRAQAGASRWHAYARGTRTTIPLERYPDIYWGWSQELFGDPSYASLYSCSLPWQSDGYCVQDSVTILPNPMRDPATSIFRPAPSWSYGANVSGGRPELRYYFGVDLQDETGAVQMPSAIVDELALQRGVPEIPEAQRKPNAQSKMSLRANIIAGFTETADLHLNAGYIHGTTRSLPTNRSPYDWNGVLARTPDAPYGKSFGSPADAFAGTVEEETHRFVGSASGQWRLRPWLLARGTAGLDLTNRDETSLMRRGEAPNSGSWLNSGLAGQADARQVASTAEFGATATARRGRITSRTSIGGQYARTLSDRFLVEVQDLPPGGSSIQEGANVLNRRQDYAEKVTLGSYIEEMVGLNERLFLTGAVRADGASAFGQDYTAVLYPKVSASWLVSEEPFFPRALGVEELRLRYAYGASGQQPQPNWSHLGFQSRTTRVNGENTTVVGVTSLGNPNLRPERVREHELGFDATALGSRLQLGVTWYRRRTVDQIQSLTLPTGYGSIFTNLGLTTQHGFELELTGHVLDTRLVSWDLMFSHGLHRTKLVDIGDAVPRYYPGGGFAEGYPLGSRFDPAPLLGYNDVNGDGIIAGFGELVIGSTPVYLGESTPPISQVLATTVGFLGRRLRVSAVLERRAGFVQSDQLRAHQCSARSCRELVDPTTPLAEQAQAFKANNLPYGFFAPGDFTRLRELTVALELPVSVMHALRVRSGTLSVSGRNLALWTKYTGPDPESASYQPNSAGAGGQASGVPQSRSWAFRLDLGL